MSLFPVPAALVLVPCAACVRVAVSDLNLTNGRALLISCVVVLRVFAGSPSAVACRCPPPPLRLSLCRVLRVSAFPVSVLTNPAGAHRMIAHREALPTPDDYFALHREWVEGFLASPLRYALGTADDAKDQSSDNSATSRTEHFGYGVVGVSHPVFWVTSERLAAALRAPSPLRYRLCPPPPNPLAFIA